MTDIVQRLDGWARFGPLKDQLKADLGEAAAEIRRLRNDIVWLRKVEGAYNEIVRAEQDLRRARERFQ